MQQDPNQQSIPIWRCPRQDLCGAMWATRDEGTTCPFCHGGSGQPAGFTWGELARAAEEFNFNGELPVLLPVPVPELVQLSTLSVDIWEGLPVFHPCGQDEFHTNWLLYDVGVVLEVYPDPDISDELKCRFVASMGGDSVTFHYHPANLWVPRALAVRLLAHSS